MSLMQLVGSMLQHGTLEPCAALRFFARPVDDPHMRIEREVGWYLTATIPALLLRCCYVYGEPALVQAGHLFSTANADSSRDALDSYMASISFDFTGLLAKIVYQTAFIFFLLCLAAALTWHCTENSRSACCAATARKVTCGQMGRGMLSALVHRPERSLPVFSNTYRQFVPDALDFDLTDIDKRDGWADSNIKLPGTRIESRCFTRSVGEGPPVMVAGDELPPGNSLATWQLSALQGHAVSYALQEHALFGPAAQPLAAAAASDIHTLQHGLRGCLVGEPWHDWPDESDRASLPVLRSDNTFDTTALLEYQEHYRRSKRQEFASSRIGRLLGRQAVNWLDRQLSSCQVRTKCCLFFKPFDISMEEMRRIAPREMDAMAQETKEGTGPDGAAAPKSPPPKRVGATGILVLPRHPDDSDSDEENSASAPRTAVLDEAALSTGTKRRLPPIVGRGSSKVAEAPADEFLL